MRRPPPRCATSWTPPGRCVRNCPAEAGCRAGPAPGSAAPGRPFRVRRRLSALAWTRPGPLPGRSRDEEDVMKGKVAFALGAVVGYVLGSRAGREHYEKIKDQAKALR